MTELLIATTNAGKVREIKDLLKDFDVKITSLADYPHLSQVEEDGKTFRDNAVKKAVTIAELTGRLTLGEDSGLQVKVLNNAPGVYSARFSGKAATDKKNNLKLLRSLKGVPMSRRQARYRCFAAIANGKGLIDVVSGSCSGLIIKESRGRNGFGYDPLFLIPRYGKTFGELDLNVKSRISHRARALKKAQALLAAHLPPKRGTEVL